MLECPFEWDVQDPCDVMSWLVNHAVAVEYEACVDDIDCTDEDQFVEDSAAVASNNPSSCSADDMNVVDNDAANIHEVQVSSEVDTLASLLDINRMKDEDDTRNFFSVFICMCNDSDHTVFSVHCVVQECYRDVIAL